MEAGTKASHPIIFYDGVCGLCDGLVQFVLRRDRKAIFRFAPLQSELARRSFLPYGEDPADLATVRVLIGDGLFVRSRAVLYVLSHLGGPLAALSLLRVLPSPVLDLGYRLVARLRYSLFGRYTACPVPDPQWQDRFLDGS